MNQNKINIAVLGASGYTGGDLIKILLNNIDLWENAPVWEPATIKTATEDWFKYLK